MSILLQQIVISYIMTTSTFFAVVVTASSSSATNSSLMTGIAPEDPQHPTPAVICNGFICPTSSPVCCGGSAATEKADSKTKADSSTAQPYCASAGGTCCSFPSALDKSRGACPANTTCCLARDGSDRKSCCSSSETCTREGQCVQDPCRKYAEQGVCVSRYCGWCCTTGHCFSLYDAAASSCAAEDTIKSSYGTCSDTCNDHLSCDGCSSNPGCGWCTSTSRCESRKATTCSVFSFVLNSTNCTLSTTKTTAAAFSTSKQQLPDWAIGLLFISAVFISVPIIIVLRKRLLPPNAHPQRQQRRRSNNGTPSENPNRPQPNAAVAAAARAAGIVKYGYGSQGSLGEVEDEIEDFLAQDPDLCIICLDRPIEVSLFPCRHFCCCGDCSLRLEASARNGRLLCPLCRAEVISMINVARRRRERCEKEPETGRVIVFDETSAAVNIEMGSLPSSSPSSSTSSASDRDSSDENNNNRLEIERAETPPHNTRHDNITTTTTTTEPIMHHTPMMGDDMAATARSVASFMFSNNNNNNNNTMSNFSFASSIGMLTPPSGGLVNNNNNNNSISSNMTPTHNNYN
eukprot:PhM_4_TR9491/c12_g1_i1/m.26012